ncbi:MAG: ThiF family adenylyltransferase, partial [Myxococcales bacterium]|nr:ThiF family adenylyltransferase [Myxococcales bacterium]
MRTGRTDGELLTYRPALYGPGFAPLEERPPVDRVWEVVDLVPSQLDELVETRCVGPLEGAGPIVRDALLRSTPLEAFGVWVHYPWSGVLVRVLPPDLFRELRLDRNRDKITASEQASLLGRTAGIVGLSIGSAIALTLAQEGVVGSLVLADFDTLSTSNMNRVRAPIHAAGLPKTVVTARQLAEIDPFVDVRCVHEGLQPEGLDAFFEGLDLVVDACDGLGMKIRLREAARARGIPVIMETSDRGMLDVERFDLEPDRPLLHGIFDVPADRVDRMGADERLALVAESVGYEVSTRAAASLIELGSTVKTWPQLASDVAAGGASVTRVVRRLMLGQEVPSGRRFLAPEDIPPALPPVSPRPARPTG